MPITRTDTNITYDADGKVIASVGHVVDITAEVVELELHKRARAAFNANRDFLGLTTPTNAQVLAQVRALTRQANALLRLGPLRDLLTDEALD